MTTRASIVRVPTGIAGFDQLANGGLPRGRTTLVSGPTGCGKTVMALQFLYFGVRDFDESGALVTFDETPSDLMLNVRSFGWDFAALVKQSRLAVVDATSNPEEETVHTGPYNLTALLARTEHAIKSVSAKRVTLDGVDALFGHFPDAEIVARELYRLGMRLRKLGVTTFVTLRQTKDRSDPVGLSADNVVLLRNRLADDKRRRTVEILKVRGASHRAGQYPFAIHPEQGFVVLDDA